MKLQKETRCKSKTIRTDSSNYWRKLISARRILLALLNKCIAVIPFALHPYYYLRSLQAHLLLTSFSDLNVKHTHIHCFSMCRINRLQRNETSEKTTVQSV